jgi:hypothetical protein
MKKLACFFLGLATLATAPAFAQQPEKGNAPTAAEPARRLTKFDLDFPGGTPAQLVAAIQKAMGRPLNVIVPAEYADWKLPPLKMNHVDVSQLFRALEQAGQLTKTLSTGSSWQTVNSICGFRTNDTNVANQSDDTVWYFYVNGQPPPPKVSRFYLLTPYLESGLTVDDITTAIQTAWKMRGESTLPTLNFHKETKLLIAFGDFGQLVTIDDALKALDPVKARPAADKPAPETKTKP